MGAIRELLNLPLLLAGKTWGLPLQSLSQCFYLCQLLYHLLLPNYKRKLTINWNYLSKTPLLLPWWASSSAVVRVLTSHQCGPGSNPNVAAICGFSLLLVLSFAPRGFSPGSPVFPSPQKPTIPNPNSARNQVDEEPLYGGATSKSLLIYLY